MTTLDIDDKGLEELLHDALRELQEDLSEVTIHTAEILQKIKDPSRKNGIEAYAHLYQEALKVKGSARERYLKLINMIKDRVRVKEVIKQTKDKGSMWALTPESILDAMDQAKSSRENEDSEDNE